MTKPERHLAGGFVDQSKLERGPNGRALCRWCHTEVPKGRRTFCGDDCVREHTIRTSPSRAAHYVFERDRGVCAICRRDTEAAEKLYLWFLRGYWSWGARDVVFRIPRRPELARQVIDAFDATGRSTWFDVDHIVPVVQGGGSCGLDNLRTLCIPCHKRVTAELAADRAHERALQRFEADPQRRLGV